MDQPPRTPSRTYVAVAASLLAVSSVATLAVIASVKDVDALSTVALALAVLAFTVQIVIYIAQERSVSSSARRSEELYAATTSALAKIEERTLGTRESLNGINEKLLTHLLEKGTSQARIVGAKEGTAEFTNEVASVTSSYVATTGPFPPRLPGERAKSLHDEMSQFPKRDDLDFLLPSIEELGDDELALLRELGVDLLRSSEPTSEIGPGTLAKAAPTASQRLVDEGIATDVWESHLGLVISLTPRGRRMARILIASPIPAWAIDEVSRIRAVAELLAQNSKTTQ